MATPRKTRGSKKPEAPGAQLLPFRASHGGRRAGAGRKPNGDRAGVSHDAREALAARFPVHVTVKLREHLPLGRGPTPVGTGFLALEQDFLLAATFSKPDSLLLSGYFGLLDLNGMGTAQLAIPAIPELQGLVFYTAYGVLNATSVLGLSKTLRTVIL